MIINKIEALHQLHKIKFNKLVYYDYDRMAAGLNCSYQIHLIFRALFCVVLLIWLIIYIAKNV